MYCDFFFFYIYVPCYSILSHPLRTTLTSIRSESATRPVLLVFFAYDRERTASSATFHWSRTTTDTRPTFLYLCLVFHFVITLYFSFECNKILSRTSRCTQIVVYLFYRLKPSPIGGLSRVLLFKSFNERKCPCVKKKINNRWYVGKYGKYLIIICYHCTRVHITVVDKMVTRRWACSKKHCQESSYQFWLKTELKPNYFY